MTKTPETPAREASLEDFALSTHSYGRLTGASLAIHAIPDAFLLLHTGVGCKYKGAGQYCLHDLARPSHHREGYTEVTDLALIKGSASRIPIYVRGWYKKRRPSFMGVASSTFLEMAGEDFAKAVEEAGRSVPCPVAYLQTLGFDGDLYDGYAAVNRKLLELVPFAKTRSQPRRVGVVGYAFDRYEMDHAGNLQQLRFLLESLGLECGPVLLSGRPTAELMELASCGRLVALPYARAYSDGLAALSGRPVVATGLPVGISGTFRWLKDVAEACGVKASVLEGCVRAQSEYARPQLDMFRSYARQRIGAGRTAVFADTPLAAGLCSLLIELGMPPVLAGLRDRSLGGRKAFTEALSRAGTPAPDDLEVLECPSLERVRSRVHELRDRRGLSLVLGSHTELSALGRGPTDRSGSGEPRPGSAEIPSVEIGFPSLGYHVLFPTPFYGVAGALATAQRIMNLIR